MRQALVALFVAVTLAAVAYARPPAPLTLSTVLNGESYLPTQPDGGPLRLYSSLGAVATASVACGATHKIMCPVTAANVCFGPTLGSDGGYPCSNSTSSTSYGEPIPAEGFLYFVASDCASTRVIAAVSQTDSGVDCPIFRMR